VRTQSGTRSHCMVVHAYYPLGETRVERQAFALRDHGVDVHVICLRKGDEPSSEMVQGITIHRLPVRRHKGGSPLVQLLEYLHFFLLASGRLTRLTLRRRFDVVQVHNLPDFLVFAALVPRLLGSKVILDLHDLMPEFYAERFRRPMTSLPVRLIRLQETLSCRFADQIITVTDQWRQALIQRGHPSEKVAVVMNVADERVFNPSVAAHDAGRRNGRFRLIYHGNMDHRYGLDLVVGAIDRVRREIADVHLTLHGGGEYRRTVEELVEKRDLRDHIEISSRFVSTEELARRIKGADLGIVPYRDGVFTGAILPTKLMEYAALGVPVVAARTPAIAAYFDEDMVEFFTPGDVRGLADRICGLYRDRARLASLATNIARFRERYRSQEHSARYVELVERLAPGRER
jgi:glycosyltransferase involved in cell wall biosynthesis